MMDSRKLFVVLAKQRNRHIRVIAVVTVVDYQPRQVPQAVTVTCRMQTTTSVRWPVRILLPYRIELGDRLHPSTWPELGSLYGWYLYRRRYCGGAYFI